MAASERSHDPFVRAAFEVILHLLPQKLTQGEIASRAYPSSSPEKDTGKGERPLRGYVISRWLSEGLDAERLSRLTTTLQEFCREARARSDDPGISARCDEVDAILAGGLGAAARRLRHALAPSYGDEVNARDEEEGELMKRVRRKWQESPYAERDGVPAVAQMEAFGKDVWPSLPARQAPYAYQAVADMLTRDGMDARSLFRAAHMSEAAESRHAASVVAAILLRSKGYTKFFLVKGISPQDRETAHERSEEMFATVELLTSVYCFSPLELADIAKAKAEHVRQSTLHPGAARPSRLGSERHLFAIAAAHYQAALNGLDASKAYERGEPWRGRAMILHYVGFCLLRAGKPQSHIWLAKSANAYLALKRPQEAAYCFKYLAMSYEACGEAEMALWCARASIGIYDACRHPKKSLNYLDAMEVEARLRPLLKNIVSEQIPSRAGQEGLSYANEVFAMYEMKRARMDSR